MKQLNQIISTDLLNQIKGSDYPFGFFRWIQYNAYIWDQFEKYGLQMASKRSRYSARTIIEVMRWDSDIRESNNGATRKPLFKLSNNMTPGLARLWMAKHGLNHPKFFQLNNM